MPSAKSFDGEIALVTGASSGLGRYFATTLAAAGARVAVASRRKILLDGLALEIEDSGGKAFAVTLDQTDSASVSTAVEKVESEFGPIDILINNAGIAVDKPIFETTEADWDSVLDTNLKGAWLMAQEVAGRMADAKRGGCIVNVASILGLTATPRVHGYAAAKAGLIHLTGTLAVELARHAIRVNAIAPGVVCWAPSGYQCQPGHRLQVDHFSRHDQLPYRIDGKRLGFDVLILILPGDQIIVGGNPQACRSKERHLLVAVAWRREERTETFDCRGDQAYFLVTLALGGRSRIFSRLETSCR